MLSGGPVAPAFENKHYCCSFKIFLCFWLARWLFWINNELIIEFGFRIIWRIMEISKGVIRLDLHYSPDVHVTQPHSKIVWYWSLLFILNISSFLIGWNQNFAISNRWRQSAAKLQIMVPLTEKTWRRGWVVLVVRTKMSHHFTRFTSKK